MYPLIDHRTSDIWCHDVTSMVWHKVRNVSCHVMFENIWTNLSFRFSQNDQIASWITLGSSRSRQMALVGSCLLVTTFPHHIIRREPLIINLSRVTNSIPLRPLSPDLSTRCKILIFTRFACSGFWMTLVFDVSTENLNNCVKSNFLVVYSGQMPHSGWCGVTSLMVSGCSHILTNNATGQTLLI